MVFKRGSTESLGGREGHVSLGIWEREKGLASLPALHFNGFYQFHTAGFLMGLGNNNKQTKNPKWEFLARATAEGAEAGFQESSQVDDAGEPRSPYSTGCPSARSRTVLLWPQA